MYLKSDGNSDFGLALLQMLHDFAAARTVAILGQTDQTNAKKIIDRCYHLHDINSKDFAHSLTSMSTKKVPSFKT
jgi:hypothetical protein